MEYDWDPAKAVSNEIKHGIAFEEAKTAVYDPFALTKHDLDHSTTEDRWIVLGYSDHDRILAISITYRGHTVRIISARKATRNEIREYENPANY